MEHNVTKPILQQQESDDDHRIALASHHELGDYQLFYADNPSLLFTENETNAKQLFGSENTSPYVKDGLDNYIVHGKKETVNPGCSGTKMAADYVLAIPPGETRLIKLRLSQADTIVY
jgi:hypothetical protein